MYEIDSTKNYRLVDVRDHEGKSKVESRDLYIERVGCITKKILKGRPHEDGRFYMHIAFERDGAGNWTNLALRTSPVSDIKESNGVVEIHTENSIYVFEPAELTEPEYQDDAELIELYLCDEGDQFCAGFYYDAEKKPHKLECSVHVGTFTDSCLIQLAERPGVFVCRYFPHGRSVEFYNTLYRQQDYSRRLLIHNAAARPLRVEFERFSHVWTIMPGEAKMIMPFCSDGADKEEDEKE